MNFLKKLLGTKDAVPVTDHASFWNWFVLHEQAFYRSVKNNDDVDVTFLEKLMPKLQQINEQFYCLTGMYDDDIAELIITAEGDVKTFVFVEELIAAAPPVKDWRFTVLKPPNGLNEMTIEMDGYTFSKDKISFYSTAHADYPDEIDLTLVHADFNEDDKTTVINGTLIYLDNSLGELNAATLIDTIQVAGPATATGDLIGIEKLEEFLLWREKEFVEKYKGFRYNTENDGYSSLEGQDENGLPVIAKVNTQLLDWDAKASHPWMMPIEIKYANGNNGMPDDETSTLMNAFEDELVKQLPDTAGYLNLGRQTYNGERTIWFACKEFRHASKTVSSFIHQYQEQLDVSYDIFKDKYWMMMNRFK